MKKAAFVLHLLLLTLTWGCDMPLSDDYYQDIQSNENAQFKLYINLPQVNGKLTVKDKSSAQFFIHCKELEIQEVIVTVGSNQSQYFTNHGFINLSSGSIKEGDNDVRFNFIAKSNNESLANQLGGELYYGEATVTVCKDSKAILPPVFEESVNERGNLKLTWESHIPDDVEITQYRMFYANHDNSDMYETHIPITSNSYSDGGYIGESATYTLFAIIKNNIAEESIYWEVGQHNVSSKLNAYQTISPDRTKITIGWNNPYKANVDVTVNGVLHNLTPSTKQLELPIDDVQTNSWDEKLNINIQYKRHNTAQYNVSFNAYTHATKVADYAAYHEASHDGRYLYTIANGSLKCFDHENNKIVGERDITGYHSKVVCTSPVSGMFAVSNSGFNSINNKPYLTIYKDANLTEQAIIENVESSYPMFMTNDNKLVYFNTGNNELVGTVCDALTGKKEKTFKLANRYAIYQILLSKDGKRVYYNLGFTLVNVELENYEVINSTDITTDSYSNVIFASPANPDELGVIDYYNNIYFINLKTGLTARSINLPADLTQVNVDKYTGNFIGYKSNTISIYSADSGSKLFTTGYINHSPILINNNLASIEGIFLNLKAYL